MVSFLPNSIMENFFVESAVVVSKFLAIEGVLYAPIADSNLDPIADATLAFYGVLAFLS